MRKAAIVIGAVLITSSAYAQDEAARKVAVETAMRVPLENAVKGAPYSAETLVEGVQALADGNRIVRKTTGRVYRDGEGRTRREDDVANGRTTISIVDPVGGYSYSLDTVNKIAWRTATGVTGDIRAKVEEVQTAMRRVQEEKINAAGNREVSVRSEPLSDEEKRKIEAAGGGGARGGRGGGGAVVAGGFAGAVGRGGARGGGPGAVSVGPMEHKTLEGVAVEGRKTTTTIPAGQVGNEQPLTIVSEEWRSTDLNVLVMTRHSDPRTGESTYRLTNIIRAEPDRSLFMVPPDYTVRESGVRRMEELKLQK